MSRLEVNNFLVVGRAGMDLYADPAGTVMEEATRFEAALGGSAANIAAGITKLGGRAALVTAVSDDAVGRFVLAQLDRYTIDASHVTRVGGEARNSLAVVETRAVNCQSVIYRNNAADFQLTEAHVAAIDLAPYGALIITGTALAVEPSRSAVLALLGRARSDGLPTWIDVDYRPYSWPSRAEAAAICLKAAELCDVIVGNDEEFALLAHPDGDGLALARQMAKRPGSIVIYKMGEKGAVTFTASGSIATPVFPVVALKPTGAGDAFLAGVATSLATGHSLPDAIRRGAAAAAIVVTRVGCAPASPTSEELGHFIANIRNP